MKTFGISLLNFVSQLVPLAVGAAVGFFIGTLTVPSGIDELKWKILSSVLGSLLTDKLWTVSRRLEERLLNAAIEKANVQFDIKLNALLDNFIKPLSNSLDRFSPYFAFHTDHGRLENLLRQSEKIQSKSKWIVPLFVSRKITQDFNSGTEVQIRTNARGYADIVEELLPFANNSIFMTCPHTPKAWFNALLADNPTALQAALNNQLTDGQFPGHVKAFLYAKVQDAKKRFVILPEGTLPEFFAVSNRPALRCFLKFSNSEYGIVTKFAYQGTLCQSCAPSCGLAKADFQVWDRAAVVEWLDHTDGTGTENICKLMLHPEAKYQNLFDSCFTRYGVTKTSEELLSFLAELDMLSDNNTLSIWNIKVGKVGLANDEA